MTKIDIYAGMLGSGKTTLISRLIDVYYRNLNTVIVENEAGKADFDGVLLSGNGIEVKTLTSGCACCTIKGDVRNALSEITERLNPDRIVMEPSGLSDLLSIMEICESVNGASIGRVVQVVNAKKILILLKAIGDFYLKQIEASDCIFLNFADCISSEMLDETMKELSGLSPDAIIESRPISEIDSMIFPERYRETGQGRSDEIFTVEELKKAIPMKITSGRKHTVYTVQKEFEKDLSEEEYRSLKSRLLSMNPERVYRGKGIVRLFTGQIIKLDYVFGDLSEEETESSKAAGNMNKVVLIGPGVRTDMLDNL